MRSYGPRRWLNYYDMHAIMCAWYYTSCCIQQNCQLHFIAWTQVHTEERSWLYSIVHSQTAWLTLPSKLQRRAQVHSEYAPKYTSEYVLKYTPWHALKHTTKHALKYTPNCIWWHTPSLLGSTLPSTLPRGKTLPLSLDYMLPCMLLGARSRDFLSCRRQASGGGWWVAGGGWRIVAEIMTSVAIIVWTLCLVHPP